MLSIDSFIIFYKALVLILSHTQGFCLPARKLTYDLRTFGGGLWRQRLRGDWRRCDDGRLADTAAGVGAAAALARVIILRLRAALVA